ncbi:MAG TPA: integrase arm-type DNA-binding domain-containing protein [Methylibium sp.]|uniref:tyrosine-type recombinase/integrase n=1 Tax=Methylibium sp. TaxID=2067992 RepID=UPI002DB95965|nr:integrase arm-type DNA-binding domain-containing protein [Methylibium sp.]HEU4458103.1 integrase arm-type DNA-binding domain-containing protein [Methylibium sp.]
MLTVKEVAAAKPGVHSDGHGLYLQVVESAAATSKTWLFRYTSPLTGKRREMGLGRLADVPMVKARSEAAKARELVVARRDPIVERDRLQAEEAAAAAARAAKAVTFEQHALAYIERNASGWRNAKHAQQWTNTLRTYAFPLFGHKAVADVDQADVMAALEPIWATKTETATRVRSRIFLVLDDARAAKLRAGENPAAWAGNLQHRLPKPRKVATVQHHPALPYKDMPAFMQRLRGLDSISALALEFTILTACRTGEALGAVWSEFDLDRGAWIIPARRMKGGREHRVALSFDAMVVLTRAHELRQGDCVFPGARQGQPLSNMALTMLVRGWRSDITVHGFRSSFRDWAAEETQFPRDLAELALAHQVGDETERAYRRGDAFERRRALMDAWADWCNGAPASNL